MDQLTAGAMLADFRRRFGNSDHGAALLAAAAQMTDDQRAQALLINAALEFARRSTTTGAPGRGRGASGNGRFWPDQAHGRGRSGGANLPPAWRRHVVSTHNPTRRAAARLARKLAKWAGAAHVARWFGVGK